MSTKYAITDLLPLPESEVQIPRLGFGVYRSPTNVCVQSCLTALKAGYRHIDTAQFYANEKEVGDAIRQSGIPRSELFITTKILVPGGSPEATYEKLLASVEKIGGPGGYIDLFLIHSANSGTSGRKEMWQALEKLLEEGKTKSIGVSNWGVKHIEELKSYAKVWPPHVNQIELHPWNQQRVIDEYCKQHGIIVEAYSPIVRNYKASDPTLVGLANKYNKTTQQVLVRYALQKEWVPLPKSDNPERIVANANIFDFDISREDMAVLDDLDQGSAGAIVEAVEND
ncbi:NADP-dependent oxidoreductase domain-containing protein [Aspergillus avenaceus]|uniref:D-xylose reductase [NAD(P)H] n=1 Tax=Aspergillus avenaceus TaxID=36643 RepID=A0A5N6THU5_ASPAV|nr:NADP-dependent oxidoreductase domain-containing protein [Aspergillus avenaceus]